MFDSYNVYIYIYIYIYIYRRGTARRRMARNRPEDDSQNPAPNLRYLKNEIKTKTKRKT